jgi:hypothetical protein
MSLPPALRISRLEPGLSVPRLLKTASMATTAPFGPRSAAFRSRW